MASLYTLLTSTRFKLDSRVEQDSNLRNMVSLHAWVFQQALDEIPLCRVVARYNEVDTGLAMEVHTNDGLTHTLMLVWAIELPDGQQDVTGLFQEKNPVKAVREFTNGVISLLEAHEASKTDIIEVGNA